MNCEACQDTSWVTEPHPLADQGYRRQARRCDACWPSKPIGDSPMGMRNMRIPAGYHESSLAGFKDRGEPKLVKAVTWCKRYVAKWPDVRRGLLFTGPPGSGKTHLAVATLKGLAKAGAQCLFLPLDQLLEDVRGRKGDERHPAFMVQVLCLDDLRGVVGQRGAFAREMVIELIRHREAEQLLTFVTTNQPLWAAEDKKPKDEQLGGMSEIRFETIDECFGPQVSSRLDAMCATVDLDGIPDFRRASARRIDLEE